MLTLDPFDTGLESSQSTAPDLRSFSVEAAPAFKALSCEANGVFTLKLGLGERELVVCPAECAGQTEALIYGSGMLICPHCSRFYVQLILTTGFYSPVSSVCRAAIHAGALVRNILFKKTKNDDGLGCRKTTGEKSK